jgi:hypothetical protein
VVAVPQLCALAGEFVLRRLQGLLAGAEARFNAAKAGKIEASNSLAACGARVIR